DLVAQTIEILLEVGRKLKQDRPELRAQRARRLEKEAQVFVDVLEPSDVGDALRGLEDEAERRRRHRIPPRDDLRRRHPIERVVDLHGPKFAGVILQPLGGRELGLVKAPLPFWEVVTGGPDDKLHEAKVRKL